MRAVDGSADFFNSLLGHPRACFNLGAFFAEGQGGFPKDLVASRHWYERAEAQGDNQAAFSLGMLLAFTFEPPLREEAVAHIVTAARLGFPAAQALWERGNELLASNRDSGTWMLALAASLDPTMAKVVKERSRSSQ